VSRHVVRLEAGDAFKFLGRLGDSPLTWAGMHWRDHETLKRLCFGEYMQ
jgi:hypothetical protein